jgi:predicted TPR repeat methyltransferase
METRLYSDYAALYHRVYPSFIDYEEQYRFFSDLLRKYDCKKVLEAGCGTGRLARRLCEAGWTYRGMDLSEAMLEIARREAPSGLFFPGDMRDFIREEKMDALIVPGRSMSYLLENRDVFAALSAFANNLAPGGKLIFDVIDAAVHFLQMDENETLWHHADDGTTRWARESRYQKNLATGWTWDWHSVYYEVLKDDQKVEIARDAATLRAFLLEEMELFLRLAGFRVVERMIQGSYAFQTLVFVCEYVE